MCQLALLVFDECHSCTGNHPSSKILRNFYHASPAEVRPSILGLSASPVVNSKAGNLGWVRQSFLLSRHYEKSPEFSFRGACPNIADIDKEYLSPI